MPNLRWLNVDSSEPDKTPVDGAKLAKLQNLRRMCILSCSHVENITAVLTALAHQDSGLRRITLRSCKLSDTDLKLLASLKSLSYITFEDVSADWKSARTIAALNLIAEKKNLKGIILSKQMVWDAEIAKNLLPRLLASPSLRRVACEAQMPNTDLVNRFVGEFGHLKRDRLAVTPANTAHWDSGHNPESLEVDPAN
jgi:hypothetical protein